VPEVKFVPHTLGGSGFPQSISVAIVGFEVLVTVPGPVNPTVKLLDCTVKSGITC
jgi:hypothetical protein